MHIRMGREELLQYSIIIFVILVEWQVKFGYFNLWEVVNHVMTESRLTVSLLL